MHNNITIKPSSLAEEDNTFTGWEIPPQFSNSANGTYTATITLTLWWKLLAREMRLFPVLILIEVKIIRYTRFN